MLTLTLRPESPTSSPGNGMAILQNVPTDPNGNLNDAVLCSQLIIQSAIVGTFGAQPSVTPRMFTRVGLVAVTAAINTYYGTTLTAGNLDQINTQLSGGLQAVISPKFVQIAVPPGGASAIATTLAALLAGANLTPIPPFN